MSFQGSGWGNRGFTLLVESRGDAEQLRQELEVKYGTILGVRKSGPVYNFIIFEREADRSQCLEELKDNPKFRARIPKDKKKGPGEIQNQNKSRGFGEGDETPRREFDNRKGGFQRRNNFHNNNFGHNNNQLRENNKTESLGQDEREREEEGERQVTPGDIITPPVTPNTPRMAATPKTPSEVTHTPPADQDKTCPTCGSLTKSTGESLSEGNKLIFIKDFEDYEKMKKSTQVMVGVVIANFPIYFLQCDMYTLCNPYVKVLQVDMRNKMVPTEIPYAFVFVANDEVASHLVKMVDGFQLKGKVLRAFKVSDVADPEDIISG